MQMSVLFLYFSNELEISFLKITTYNSTKNHEIQTKYPDELNDENYKSLMNEIKEDLNIVHFLQSDLQI